MKRLGWKILIGALVAVGAWQIGSASYIYAKAWLAQILIADAWTQTLAGKRHVRPWPWADTWPIARLRVPKEHVDLYVLSDATGRSLAFGPGWLSGSAAPGHIGNTVIAAHRDTHFSFLRDVTSGMMLQLQTSDSQWHSYTLTQRFVLDSRNQRLAVQPYRSTVTLITCYPFDAIVPGGPLRYAVLAEPQRVDAMH